MRSTGSKTLHWNNELCKEHCGLGSVRSGCTAHLDLHCIHLHQLRALVGVVAAVLILA